MLTGHSLFHKPKRVFHRINAMLEKGKYPIKLEEKKAECIRVSMRGKNSLIQCRICSIARTVRA